MQQIFFIWNICNMNTYLDYRIEHRDKNMKYEKNLKMKYFPSIRPFILQGLLQAYDHHY